MIDPSARSFHTYSDSAGCRKRVIPPRKWRWARFHAMLEDGRVGKVDDVVPIPWECASLQFLSNYPGSIYQGS